MSDPLKKEGTVSWLPVVAVLVGLPLGLSVLLWLWLGTSRTGGPDEVFDRMEIRPVPVEQLQTLEFQGLWFGRLRLREQPRDTFTERLSHYEKTRGAAEEPITFKLKRGWWDPDTESDGTYYRHQAVTVWVADSRPLDFFLVIDSPHAGSR